MLLPEDKLAILKDFKEWTGGFDPEECDIHQIEDYAYIAADKKYNYDDVVELLTDNSVPD